MSAASWAVAVAGWLVVGMLPGFLLATALRPAATALTRWAAAPLVTIGVAYAGAAWVDLLHRGWGLAAAGATLLLTVAGSLVVVIRRSGLASLRPGPWTRGRLALVGVLTVSLLLGLSTVALAPNGWGSLVPYDDGVSHGVFATRIALTGSVDPLRVAVSDVADATGGLFYPLGLHTVAALLGSATGTPVAITAAGVVAATVWAPLALASWARTILGPAHAVLAAAILALASPWFPTAQLQWGGWSLVAAVALVPAAARLLLDADDRRAILLAATALAGLLAIHVSEVLVVLLLCAATWALDPGLRTRRRARRLVLHAAAASAVAAVVLVPSVGALLSRAGAAPADVLGLGPAEALAELLTHPVVGVSLDEALGLPTALLVLAWWTFAVLGTRALWRSPAARGSAVVVWGFVGLALLALLGIAVGLTLPWYSNGYRLLAQAVALAPLPLAAAAVLAWQRAGAVRVAAVGLCTVVAVALAASTLATASTAWRSSVVTADDRAAITYLATRLTAGERVLNDPRDGTGWAYALTDGAVAPGFAVHPDDWRSHPSWTDRWRLHDLAAVDDPRVDALLDEWRIRYAVTGTGAFPQTEDRLTSEELRGSARWREEFCSGSACVFVRR